MDPKHVQLVARLMGQSADGIDLLAAVAAGAVDFRALAAQALQLVAFGPGQYPTDRRRAQARLREIEGRAATAAEQVG